MSAFLCWIPDYGQELDDAGAVETDDAALAATIFMERYEAKSAEYPVASGGSIVVAVAPSSGAVEMYSVWGEAVPCYHARKVKA